ncbi:hypothetical protein [Streptomyces aidingensis]|uniref:Uncharacterized protein n=1 Tax=Streptomyces aidingensis TaxID=910347 RepID=A0A1I1PS54_9ACTN|nr:hypothetical protein [Streptomyces aidingensis]SFD12585.1 hypothetical protein SAMN05421773_11017 [Streptomyces aidingensis]
MSERDPLAGLLAAEVELFRIGTLARRLIAEHPDMPVYAMGPFRDAVRNCTVLDIHAADDDNVHAWAALLGAAVEESVTDGRLPYRSLTAETEVDGVPVCIHHGSYLFDQQAGEER